MSEEDKDNSKIPRKPSVYDRVQNSKIVCDTDELDKVAKFIKEFNPKDDKYRKSLEAQGYVAAREAKTGNYTVIASNLGLQYAEFKYYLDTKPEFAAAIRKGILDGKEELKETLVQNLIKKAVGYKVENLEVTDNYTYDNYGSDKVITGTKIKTTTTEIPPDTQAAIKLLEQIDPSWRQRNQLDVNMNVDTSIDVTENIVTAIDLTKLSPSALEEILISQQAERNNTLAYKREDGSSVIHEIPNDIIVVEEKPKKKVSEETREKMRKAHQKRAEAREKNKKKLEDGLRVEDIKNGE